MVDHPYRNHVAVHDPKPTLGQRALARFMAVDAAMVKVGDNPIVSRWIMLVVVVGGIVFCLSLMVMSLLQWRWCP